MDCRNVWTCIMYDDGSIETKPFSYFSEQWEIPPQILAKRYRRGLRNTDLLMPLSDDILTSDYAAKLWRGKWVYKGKGKQPIKVMGKKNYRGNLRWVLVTD